MDARARENLDLLSVKLRRAQADYEWACSRGDVEHASHFQIKIKGITAERDFAQQAACLATRRFPRASVA